MAQPRVDGGIPPLVSTAGLAALAGTTRSDLAVLHAAGLLPGRVVGPNLVVFKPALAKKLQGEPKPANPTVDKTIPPLVTSEAAAELRGVSRQALDRWFRIGKLPGRKLSTHILVFRAATVNSQVKEAIGESRDDPKIPDIVAVPEAADILGVTRDTVEVYYQIGWLPGRQVKSKRVRADSIVFRREVVRERIGQSPPYQPATDETIPEVLTTGQAAELAGLTRDQVVRLYRAGELPGRVVEGSGKGLNRTVFRPETVRKHVGGASRGA